MINWFFGLFSYDVGIDLGTANTLVLVTGKGIVVREPTVVAINKKSKDILAIGTEAKKMVGRTPSNIVAIRPLKDGVISDFEQTAAMLSYYIHKIHTTSHQLASLVPRPRVAIGIPSKVTEVERRAVSEAALSAGARKAYLIEEPMAAAIGAGLAIEDASGSMIVDIGGGTCEIAVISLGGVVVSKSLKVAGDEMDGDIVNYVRTRYNILLGEKTAEEAKIEIGSAYPNGEEKETVVRGRDLETGLPKSIKITSSQLREAISPSLSQITNAIADTIEETPPELVSDIVGKGIVICGGGALIPGIAKLIASETKMPTIIADDPITCVVRGCGKVLEDPALLEKVRIVGGIR